MIRNNLSIQETVDRLNEMLALDKEVTNALVSMRFNIGSRKLVFHPDIASVQAVDKDDPEKKELSIFGMLGLLNFLYGLDENGQGPILAHWENWELTKFTINPRCKIPNIPQE